MRKLSSEAEKIMIERFGKDTVIALATVEQEMPYVRNVEALQKALHTLEQQDQHSLLVQHYKNFSRVLYQNIIYVRKTARSVQIITSNQGVIKDNRGIKELFGILNDPRFIFVDRSYFVNLDYGIFSNLES